MWIPGSRLAARPGMTIILFAAWYKRSRLIAHRRAISWRMRGLILIKAERVHLDFPVATGPGYAVALEKREGVGADFPFRAHANIASRRDLGLHRLAVSIDAGMAAAVRKSDALGPFRPQTGLRGGMRRKHRRRRKND